MMKEELRIEMKRMRNSLTPEELLHQNLSIRRRLLESEAYLSSKLLFTYLSFQSEVDTWEIIKDALSGKTGHKKRVFLPRVEGKQMNFYEVTELNSLKKSKFGVPEPDDSHRVPFSYHGSIESPEQKRSNHITVDTIQKPARITGISSYDLLMLMPGLAFDPTGNRVGYGAGYYDKYLSEHSTIGFHKLALAYDFQILDRIPSESFDVKVDSIITPERSIHCSDELLLLR